MRRLLFGFMLCAGMALLAADEGDGASQELTGVMSVVFGVSEGDGGYAAGSLLLNGCVV